MEQQIDTLKNIKQMTQSLVDCKSDLLSKTEALEHKQQLLEEIKAECQRLKKEKRTLLEMIQSVQRDIDAVSEAELLLGRERDELQRNVNRIQTEQYDPLHERVNELRMQHGLQKIPHIRKELEDRMAKMLEERRTNWQQSNNLPASPTPTSEPSSSLSSRRRMTSSSRSNTRRR
ncbi:hypothetical protein VTP01DRAFT_10574 [Rhizomucor pusillus]|uniref:uncharacterized protein n=1 Tax=Rhizomucor pusillus TaxID=4840 RepID=UPI00374379C5